MPVVAEFTSDLQFCTSWRVFNGRYRVDDLSGSLLRKLMASGAGPRRRNTHIHSLAFGKCCGGTCASIPSG